MRKLKASLRRYNALVQGILNDLHVALVNGKILEV